MIFTEKITQEHQEYIPIAKKFPTGEQGFHSAGLILEKTVFAAVVLLYIEKRKLRTSRHVSCKIREIDKAVHKTIFERNDDESSFEVKGRLAYVE